MAGNGAPTVRLSDVYARSDAYSILYDLLKQRTSDQSISHRRMPSWAGHCAFVDSRPYQFWYLIEEDDKRLGAVYLTERLAEIGLWLFRSHDTAERRSEAINLLMQRHPRPRFVVNINPRNGDLIETYTALGFRHIQNTYELVPAP